MKICKEHGAAIVLELEERDLDLKLYEEFEAYRNPWQPNPKSYVVYFEGSHIYDSYDKNDDDVIVAMEEISSPKYEGEGLFDFWGNNEDETASHAKNNMEIVNPKEQPMDNISGYIMEGIISLQN
jgi:hypothetical protein